MVIIKIEPLSFGGTIFFAFITANCGATLRDFITKENLIKRIPRGVSIEITILWGIAFSVLLDMYKVICTIKYSMIIVISGVFITSLLDYHFSF
ncbi:hypothetical protein RCA_04125 [Rickettsia canadensis str. CA410]|uniref:Uncharacterized protein n=2 Tax=Rickettsia canadensis TaxID=788 RepID=A0ABN4AA35_RICCA|nr:hypothetical protein RCA_04125 [Rickettsia canadensis str. CA410]